MRAYDKAFLCLVLATAAAMLLGFGVRSCVMGGLKEIRRSTECALRGGVMVREARNSSRLACARLMEE